VGGPRPVTRQAEALDSRAPVRVERVRWVARDHRRDLAGSLKMAPGVDDLVDQADPLGFLRVDLPPGHQQVQGPR